MYNIKLHYAQQVHIQEASYLSSIWKNDSSFHYTVPSNNVTYSSRENVPEPFPTITR